MDWLRRNWPDLLIGIALIAVIAGIVATLLTGGSFFPLGGGSQTNTPSTPNVAPADPGPAPVTGPEALPPGGDPGLATPATPGAGAATPDAPPPQADTPSGSGAIAVLPPASDDPDPGTTTPNTAGGETAPSTAPGATNVAGGTAAPAGQVEPVQSGSSDATSSAPPSASVPTAPYRVSVGAFGSEENAQALAQTFRAEGFPVFLGRQGELVLVLVGPYDTQQEAEQAVSRIRGGGFGIDPVIYRFQPDEATGAAADATTAPPPPAAAPAEPAQASGAQTPPVPPAAEDGTFLQVGAYANRESALPQIQRLQTLGFEVTELEESGLVKLLVGPYQGDALAQARARLADEGIEHFPR